jgi:hypothetical protein
VQSEARLVVLIQHILLRHKLTIHFQLGLYEGFHLAAAPLDELLLQEWDKPVEGARNER